MLYCERCQVLSCDETMCPMCGSRKLRSVSENDPVLLFTAGAEETQRIAAAFDDAGIPHMERIQGGGRPTSIVLGQSRCAQMRIFVPYGKIDQAKDIMLGIGALKDDGEKSEPAQQDEQAGKKTVPMSSARRTAVRIFSALLFLILVVVVVAGADTIVNLFKSFFH